MSEVPLYSVVSGELGGVPIRPRTDEGCEGVMCVCSRASKPKKVHTKRELRWIGRCVYM